MSWENDKPMPCPFCGASGKERYIELCEDETAAFINCKFCGAFGPRCEEMDDACMKWNRRVS
jgi:hypothetical protein